MLFIVSWTGDAQHRNAAIERFKKTGGAPPAGVKMLGRWHSVGSIEGFAIAEATDPVAVQKWVLDWSDLLTMQVRPAVNDEQLGQALAAMSPTP
jgi:hypothetical protein